jgi:hypothetical protein
VLNRKTTCCHYAKPIILAAVPGLILIATPAHAKDTSRDALWAAVRNGDARAIRAALDAGADVNARNEIGVTALWIATTKGKPEVADLFLDRGADVNARDGVWYQTPLSMSMGGFGSLGNAELAKRLLKAGAKDVDAAALTAAARGNVTLLRLVLDTGNVTRDALDAALYAAPEGRKEVREVLTKAGGQATATGRPEGPGGVGPARRHLRVRQRDWPDDQDGRRRLGDRDHRVPADRPRPVRRGRQPGRRARGDRLIVPAVVRWAGGRQ